METNLSELVETRLNKPCVIVGPGPTMLDFPYKDFNGTIITIGDAALRGKNIFNPDFWVCSNSHFPVPDISYHLEIINSFKTTTFLFSETELYGLLWQKSDDYLKSNLKVNWVMFDERHFLGKKCNPIKKCCNLIRSRNNSFTIQELVSKVYKFDEVAKQGGTVFEYALCLALILGCNPIYIQGVDLPISVNNKKIDYFRIGDLGQEYLVRNELEDELKILYKKTFQDISKQSKRQITETFPSIINKFQYLIKKIFNLISKKKLTGFSGTINTILNNCEIYSKIAKENNIKIYNLSPNSTLKKVKNIDYLDPKNIKLHQQT